MFVAGMCDDLPISSRLEFCPRRRRSDHQALVRTTHEGRRQQKVRGGPVAGDGRVVYDRNPEQGFDIDVMRVRFERVPKEDHEIEPPLNDRRAHLLIATEWATQKPHDR
jgi:hypothetical protein